MNTMTNEEAENLAMRMLWKVAPEEVRKELAVTAMILSMFKSEDEIIRDWAEGDAELPVT